MDQNQTNAVQAVVSSLENFDIDQLESVRASLIKLIEARQQEFQAEARREIMKLMQKAGLSLSDINGGAANGEKKVKNQVASKYAHPQNPENKWTGRGRQPLWVVDWLANGGSLDDLLIK